MPGVVVPPSSGKVNHFGIEVASGITWQGWEPGREYNKNIVLKNVRVKMQKLKYKVPQSRFFTTLYPQPIVLSAGTSFTLPLTFRPLEKVTYEDVIEFSTNEGSFSVPIRAVLPQVEIEAPEHINFSMCAAQDTVQLSFDIKNASELVTPFRVDCLDPFVIEPPEGTLQPFGTFTLNATFKPQAAVVYEAEAIIAYGDKYADAKITRLEGIGKFPHLLVSSDGQKAARTQKGALEAVVSFGEVAVGQTLEKWIELQNLSPVSAPFVVKHPTGGSRIDTVFQCLQKDGVVPPHSTLQIPIVYNPTTVGSQSVDYFHVVAIGNVSKTIVKCCASSKGPQVYLSSTAVNFYQIDAGYTATKTVDLVNESGTEATYQFMIDCEESVFKFESTSGTLAPHSKRTVILQFEPSHPINYYRQVPCLVHNQDAVFLDLLGTCHTETAKPAVLQVKHIENFKVHAERGLSFIPPEQLNEMVKDSKLKVDQDGTLVNAQDDGGGPSVMPAKLHPMDEYFNDGYHTDITSSTPHVSMDIHEADFGRCSDMRLLNQMTVNLTNHTKGKITIVWMGGPDHVFSVTPATMDIPSLGSAPFTVTFRPNAPNQFYGCQLECYAHYKSLRDYRLVEDVTHSPPWCLTLTATAHTFLANNETFLPRFTLDSNRVVFPAVNAHEATYRTILLTNTGTTPILYDFEKDPTGIFSMKPTKGLLRSGCQMFVMKILPTAVKTYKHVLRLKLNDADKNTQEVTAWGSAEAAEVMLDSMGVMFFKPTCVGTASHRQYTVTNVSRIPLRFEWKMNHADAKLLSVCPAEGIIQPNESQHHEWSFTPQEQVKHVMKPSLVVCGQGQSSQSSAGKKRLFTVRVIGEGALGEIKAEQTYMDFGTVVVGSSASRQVALYNESDCSLHYKLHVDQNINEPGFLEDTSMDPIGLQLDRMEGILPARSKHIIPARVRPHRRVCYQFAISYQLLAPEGGDIIPVASEPQHLCHVLATGVFPTLAVTDARCYGSNINISKKQLWRLFSLDNLNVCLDSDPSAAELMYSASTRHSHRRRPPVYTRAILDFNFGAAPIGSEECVVQLMLENTGAVPTDWAFLFPRDLQLELEYWAETGEFDEDELHEMKVMDNQLFSVEPVKGMLHPGECHSVTFRYHHIMPGTDRLPVLLKLARGREILLNFIGVTTEPDRRYIHFPSNKFMFSPVPIAEKESPKQVYEIYNGGALPVKYEFNTTPLEMLKRENYDHAVLECLNPVGEIEPGRTANIEFRFSPLEAKTYMVDVPISIHNGDTALITFTAVGYDKRALGNTLPMTDQHELSGVPAVQSVSVPGQLCYLSEERISFGNLPLFSRVRRMVVMMNKSTQHATWFQWHVTSYKDSQFVSIWPSRGSLQPGEAKVCRVTFTSRGVPSFYDLDLVCEVTNETEFRSYESELVSWERERQRQQEEFTITEQDPDADQRPEDSQSERPPSGRLKALEGVRTPSPDTDLAKYTTLPPIKQVSIDQERARERECHRLKSDYWERPLAPKPFLLHLGVTARTHDITHFQTNFHDAYCTYFIDRTLSVQPQKSEAVQTAAAPAEPVPCMQAEADVVAGALSSVIRGLLDDSSFHESVLLLAGEGTPFYHQFSEKTSTTPTTPAIQIEEYAEYRTSESPEESRMGECKTSESLQEEGSGEKPATPQVSTSQRLPTPEGVDVLRLDNKSRESSPSSLSSASSRSSSRKTSPCRHQDFSAQQQLKKTGEFGSILESVMENAIMNIMQEAFNQEFNITTRPRLVAMLPRPNSGSVKN